MKLATTKTKIENIIFFVLMLQEKYLSKLI